jgi:TolA-binding protein
MESDDIEKKISKENPRTRVQKLLWLFAGLIIVVLIVLLLTNVILFRRVGELKAELIGVKAEQLKFQKDVEGQIIEPAEATEDDEAVEPDLDDQMKEIFKPIEVAASEEAERMLSAESTEEESDAEQLPELKTGSEVAEAYNQSLSDCMSGQYNQAIKIFRQVLRYQQPHELKDNAQYWLAECYYAQKRYIQALAEFRKVKELFPKADKVFDAELKIAYTYYKLNRFEAARHRLLQLSEDWPQEQYQSKIAVLSEKIEADQQE